MDRVSEIAKTASDTGEKCLMLHALWKLMGNL